MTDEEIKECKFIDRELRFLNFSEFVKDRVLIKSIFVNLKTKIFYHWYIEANTHLNNKQKIFIWEYLNNDIEERDVFETIKNRSIPQWK